MASDENDPVERVADVASEHSPSSTVLAFIEIPRGSRNKYEYDEKTGRILLDRVLYSSVHYPTDYGFIPDTLGEDNDPLDILVLVQEPTFPGCVIESRPLGGLDMSDEEGSDFKVLAVPVGDPRFAHVETMEQLGDHWLREIETFFATYKLLEPKQTEVLGWHTVEQALDVIEVCRERYRQVHGLDEPEAAIAGSSLPRTHQ